MKREFDSILKHALSPENEPDLRLNERIIGKAEEMIMANGRKKRFSKAALASLAVVFTLLVGSTVGFAAWRYLSPEQIAREGKDDKLAEAFSGEDALFLNETQEYGGYKVTLLGVASGQNISNYLNEDSRELQNGKSYIVVAIEHADGTPMPDISSDDYGNEAFFTSPYIKGLNPAEYNILYFGSGYSAIVNDGVEYRIVETTNVENFADRGLYIGVNDGTFYNRQAFSFDEATGEITRNEAYEGLNALFSLPIDPAKANPQAAADILSRIDAQPDGGETSESVQEDEEVPVETDEVEAWVRRCEQAMADGELAELARVIPETVQTCTVDRGGEFSYSWEVDGHGSASGTNTMENVFGGSAQPGTMVCLGYHSGGHMESAILETATLNEDGTVTYAAYEPAIPLP